MKPLSRLLNLYPVTAGFALISVLVYLAMIYSGAHFANPHNQALIAWGGNFRPLTVNGQGWRLLTSIFVHGGWLHLLMNTIALFDIGHLLEQKIGRRMLFVIFILSGLFGGICSLVWHPNSVGVGASAAILGMAGALLVWLALPKLERAAEMERKVQVRALMLGLGLTLGMGLFIQRIDNAAHFGGFFSGVALGALVYLLDRLEPAALKRWLAAFVLLIAGLLLVWQQLRAQKPDEYIFRKNLPQIANIIEQYRDVSLYLQQRANAEQLADTAPSRIWLDEAYQQASRAWGNCLYLSQEWSVLKLPAAQKNLATDILASCNLRARQYQLLRAALHKPGSVKLAEIQQLVSKAQGIEQKMQQSMRRELQMDAYLRAQEGMSLTGKRK